MLFLALGMIEFDGIFILIGYAMVVATTLLYAVLGTIIWEMLVSWGQAHYALTFHSGSKALVRSLPALGTPRALPPKISAWKLGGTGCDALQEGVAPEQ